MDSSMTSQWRKLAEDSLAHFDDLDAPNRREPQLAKAVLTMLPVVEAAKRLREREPFVDYPLPDCEDPTCQRCELARAVDAYLKVTP